MKDKEQNQPQKNEQPKTPSENSLPDLPQKNRRDFIKIGIAGVTVTGITFFGKLFPNLAQAAHHSDACDPSNMCMPNSSNTCGDNSCSTLNACTVDTNTCDENTCGGDPFAVSGNVCTDGINTCTENNSCYGMHNRCEQVTCSGTNTCDSGYINDCSGSRVSCSEENSCGERNTL